MDLPTLELNVDGVPYVVETSDIDGLEWRDIKRETGMTPKQVIVQVAELDFEALAGLLWVVRRREEKGLPYEKVLAGLSASVLSKDEDEDEADEVPPTSPADGDS